MQHGKKKKSITAVMHTVGCNIFNNLGIPAKSSNPFD